MAIRIPKDNGGVPLYLLPRTPKKSSTRKTSISSAVEVAVTTGASIVRFVATGASVVVSFTTVGGTAVSTDDNGFDVEIPAGGIEDYAIPTSCTAFSVKEVTATAALSIIQY